MLRHRIERLFDVVHIEHIGDPLFLDTAGKSDRYREAMEELAAAAGQPKDTLAELGDALAHLAPA